MFLRIYGGIYFWNYFFKAIYCLNSTKIVLSKISKDVQTKQIALFAFTGCYGHDVMMRQVGDEFDNFDVILATKIGQSVRRQKPNQLKIGRNFLGYLKAEVCWKNQIKAVSFHDAPKKNTRTLWLINWVQIYMYNFGFGQIEKPRHWKSYIMDRSNDTESEFVQEGNLLLWHTIVPIDYDRPWDLRGLKFLGKIVFRNDFLCAEFHKSKRFHQFLNSKNIDLVIVDHFLQECFTVAASLLNAPTIQFSNWPICDGYVSSLNVPSPPSYVPNTSTLFSGSRMNFLSRLRNTFAHLGFYVGRAIQSYLAQRFYLTIGITNVDLFDVEARHLFYAGRSELLFDVIRPISNRIKHFGCSYCKHPSAYYIRRPMQPFSTQKNTNTNVLSHQNFNVSKLDIFVSCNKQHNQTTLLLKHCLKKSKNLKFKATNSINQLIVSFNKKKVNVSERPKTIEESIQEERYCQTQKEFSNFDLSIIENDFFVLVSFGSVAKVEFMPEKLLNIFLTTFGNLSFNIIWQTNSDVNKFFGKNRKIPKNVFLHRWLPIKILLAHRNLRYAILHGGINTINEVLMFGVPILGVPLQGDQPSNLQRITELGLGELILIKEIWAGKLSSKIKQMDAHRFHYAKRARLIASMINMHRHELKITNEKSQQNFWLHWAARHGQKIKSSTIFRLKYRTIIKQFGVVENLIYLFVIFISICFLWL